jgi:CHAT domain-containing protein/tetratricopeptide (TPR) repeat protein
MSPTGRIYPRVAAGPSSARRAGVFRGTVPLRRLLAATAAILGSALMALAAGATLPAEPVLKSQAPRFGDEYVRLRDLWRESPDSASAAASRRLSADPDHFLAAWLRGQLLVTTPADSAAGRQLLTQAEQEPGRAGVQVTAATMLFARGDVARARTSLQRAHDAYAAAGRRSDACRALFWKLVLRRGSQVVPEITRDLQDAEAAARALGDPDALADVLLTRAEIEYRQSARTALQTRIEALALLSNRPPGHQLIECLRQLSNAYKTLGDLTTARRHGARALELAQSLGYQRQELMALRALAHLDRAEGALSRAREQQIRAVAMARALRENDILARCYGDLGNLARDMGRYREAKEAYTEGLRGLGPTGGDPGFQALILDGLASTECRLGNYRDARLRYEEALAVCRTRGLEIRVPAILADLAQLHLDTGNPERALTVAEEGIAAAAGASNRRQQISLLLLQSRALQELGRDEAALDAARTGRRLAHEGVPQLQWDLMRREAGLLEALGRRPAAEALLDTTAALFGTMPDTLELAVTLRLQGQIRASAGEPARALPLLQRSLAILRQLHGPAETAQTRLALGSCLRAAGREREAVVELESGLRGLEEIRSSFTATGERAGFAAAWYSAYADLARAHVALGQPEAAFAALERGRGRSLREALSLGATGLRARVPGVLGESLRAVETELAGLQSALREEHSPETTDRSPALGSLERRVDSLKTVWSDLALRVEHEAPGFACQVGRLPVVGAREVQAALRPGERLVAYLVGVDATLVFTVAPKELAVAEIPWGEARLGRRVADLVAALRDGPADAWRAAAAALADTLLGGRALAGATDRALYILPDGALHLLPFEALLVGDRRGDGRVCLLERAPVVYASSATLLLHPARPPAPGRDESYTAPLVAFGDPALVAGEAGTGTPGVASGDGLPALRPLPNARREVEALPGLVPGARVFVGEQATERRFWEETARAGMVHVAAHAFVDDRHPEFSGIVLSPAKDPAGDGTDDGILQAQEIAEHSQDLQLVTLSACETGAGRLLRGEGLLSLARAFRLMGARNLVVSLWKVDDAATMRFMAAFYRRLAEGQPPAVALRGAKTAALRSLEGADGGAGEPLAPQTRGVGRRSLDGRSSVPAAWAPFVLLGERVP